MWVHQGHFCTLLLNFLYGNEPPKKNWNFVKSGLYIDVNFDFCDYVWHNCLVGKQTRSTTYMKNVTKILMAAALCTAIFANQRIDALGGDSGFWSDDRDNINSFPATINDHSFLEFDNVGDAGDGNEAATILFDDDGTKWGMSWDHADADNWFNLMWGNGDMGVTFGFTSAETAAGSATSGLSLSWGQTMGFGELGVGYSSLSDDAVANDVMDMWVNWRSDMDLLCFDNAKAHLAIGDNADGSSDMDLDFDVWKNLDAGGATVVLGMGFGYASNTAANDDNWTQITLPEAYIGFEGDMTDWATVRGHYSHGYALSTTDDAGTDDGYVGAANASWGFGLGFNWGSFTADCGISEDMFQDPFGVTSGFDNLTTSEITMSWNF